MNRDHHKFQKQFFNRVTVMVMLVLMLALIVCNGISQPVNIEATIAAGLAATQQAELKVQATIEAGVAATQAVSQSTGEQISLPTPSPTMLPTSPPSTPVPNTPIPAPNTPTAIPDSEQVRGVILNETTGAISQDLAFLKALYAFDAVVVDHKGTPDNLGDDTIWRGWINIERYYLEFFASGFSSLNLVDLSIQMNGNRAIGSHQGVVLDGTLYSDDGVYTLEKVNGQWLITQLEFGNKQAHDSFEASGRDDGFYVLRLGGQHRYEEPWGWDRGDPCEAWATGNFDDTQPNYRGFNIELLLTNNSEIKVPDNWPISFTTAQGKSVKACYYGYEDAGPSPGTTNSVTFFTVVEKGDFVEMITLNLNGQTVRLCLDGGGGWSHC